MRKPTFRLPLIRSLSRTLLGAGCAFTLLAATPADAVSLKENSVVTDATLKLGDLFSDLESGHDRVLGASPRPGTEMVLNARTLLRIAIALDLPWRPASSSDYLVVRRAATIVERAQIEDALKSEIAQKGVDGNFNLLIPGNMSELILPQDMPASVEVKHLSISRDSGFFEATLVAPSKSNPVKEMKLNGTIEKMVEIPVLRTTLQNGDIIGERDFDMIEIREKDLKNNMATNPQNLIGMTPRRMVMNGKPINIDDLQQPIIVGRGDLITMSFAQGGLSLTVRGKALENGAKGDHIRVMNLSSNKMIDAEVSGSKEVIVRTF